MIKRMIFFDWWVVFTHQKKTRLGYPRKKSILKRLNLLRDKGWIIVLRVPYELDTLSSTFFLKHLSLFNLSFVGVVRFSFKMEKYVMWISWLWFCKNCNADWGDLWKRLYHHTKISLFVRSSYLIRLAYKNILFLIRKHFIK